MRESIELGEGRTDISALKEWEKAVGPAAWSTWLNMPNVNFAGRTPAEALETGRSREVLSLLSELWNVASY